MRPIISIAIGIWILSVLSIRITRYFDLERWQVSIALIILAIFLYFLNNWLIQFYIRKRTPNLASEEELLPGVQAWELTAGMGIVPKWVSLLAMIAISAFITAVLPWIIAIFK